MPEARIDVKLREQVAIVTVANKAKLNTMTGTLMDEFTRTIDKFHHDESLRVVIVTGAADRAFIGGANIDEMSRLNPETGREFIAKLHRCCEALRDLPVPVIAKIRGYALGAGLEIAAACDLRIASAGAQFGMPEVKVGIPSVIEAALLPPLIGWGRARQMLLLGETIGAPEALAWGLVEKVVSDDQLDSAVENWVASILRTGRNALRLQKQLIRQWENLPMRDAIAAGIDSFAEAWKTDEPREMMHTFLNRRSR